MPSCCCVRLLREPERVKSEDAVKSTPATQINASEITLLAEPGVKGDTVPLLELDASTTVVESAPVHSSTITAVFMAALISVTVTVLAVEPLFFAYQISKSKNDTTDLERTLI